MKLVNCIYRNLFYLFSVVTLPLIFSSCNGNEEPAKINRLSFNIDSTQLAGEVKLPQYGISFNPPVNLVHSDEFFNKLSSSLSQNSSAQIEISTTPVEAFIDKKFNVLVVSAIEPKIADTAINNLDKVTGILKKQFGKENMKHAEYLKENIKISQFLIQDSINVIFKLLLQNKDKKVLQYDYIIPQKNYKDELRAIESSIGSIRYIK